MNTREVKLSTVNEIPILNKTLFLNTQMPLSFKVTVYHLFESQYFSLYHYSALLCICTQLLMFCSYPALNGSLFTSLLAFLFFVSQKHLVGSLLAKIIPGTITAEPLRKRTQRQLDKDLATKLKIE